MFNWLLKNRLLVLAAFLLLLGAGIWALTETPVDAIPDVGENQQIVYSEWMGRSPKDVEDQITYPLSVQLQGLPGVKEVRGQSGFGFSMIYVIFDDKVDFYWARTRVLERLARLKGDLPADAVPVLGPDATGLGQVFWYTVEGNGYSLDELRSIQDFYIAYQLQSVRGVAEVASVGGFVRQYQVDVDPNRLADHAISIHQLSAAIERANIDVGAKVIQQGGMEYVVRGVGFIKSIIDIENIVVTSRNGIPVYVRNLARVQVGPAFRRGALDKNGQEAVGGVVIARFGENPLEVIRNTKEKIAAIEPGLPEGVKIVPFYDRSDLITRSVNTLRNTLAIEIIIVVLIVTLFLLHFSSTFTVSLVLPVGVAISFIFMKIIGITSNIMSLAGVAIAIGVMVDYGIIMTENIYRKRAQNPRSPPLKVTAQAAREVAPPILVAILTTLISFAPVFGLTGQEGKLFGPLAWTKTLAIGAAALISLVFIPVLASFLIRGRLRRVEENPVSRAIVGAYRPILRWALKHKLVVVILAAGLTAGGLATVPFIGGEFMPPLDEGSILFMPVTLPSASLPQVMEVMRTQDSVLSAFPEVSSVVGKLGRAETATDPAPVSMIETVINLKPRRQWRKGMTKEKLVTEMDAALQIPGVSNIWTQPIINRIDMLSTGIRTQVGAKIMGPDIRELERIGLEVEAVLHGVPGAADLFTERPVGKPYIEIEINRQQAARYGISVGEIQHVIMTAVGGMEVTTVLEGLERYELQLRYPRAARTEIGDLGRILVPTEQGAKVPLGQLASINRVMGPAMINSENGIPRSYVLMNVRGRDVMGFVREASRTVNQRVELPPGYSVSWGGNFTHQVSARRRLSIIVPISLIVILLILYQGFKSFRNLGIIALALPLSIAGGLLLQVFLGYNFSVAVWVGYIALFGVATDSGVLMMSVLQNRLKDKSFRDSAGVRESVIDAASLRVRPALMTVATTLLAMLVILFSSGTGSEVVKPMAAPTVGGLFTATVANLILVPVLYSWFSERRMNKTL